MKLLLELTLLEILIIFSSNRTFQQGNKRILSSWKRIIRDFFLFLVVKSKVAPRPAIDREGRRNSFSSSGWNGSVIAPLIHRHGTRVYRKKRLFNSVDLSRQVYYPEERGLNTWNRIKLMLSDNLG